MYLLNKGVPKTVSILDKVRAKLKNKPAAQAEALKWFRAQIRELGGTSRSQLLADPNRAQEDFEHGVMFLFVYDPKLKKVLPYYDKFPLVFPIEFYNDGFLGLNLHYLPYKERLQLLSALMEFRSRKNLEKRTMLRLSYSLLKQASGLRAFKPCLKRYLNDHVRSKAIRIGAQDWETAIFLPVENFAKWSKTKVWADSLRIINDNSNVVSTNGLPKKKE